MEPSTEVVDRGLEQALPQWEWSMEQAIDVHRPPAEVYAALKDVRPRDMWLARLLAALRFGHGNRDEDLDRSFGEVMRDGGWVDLVDEPGHELIVGLAGKFWETDAGVRRLGGAEEFAAFAEPGTAKVVFGYRLEPTDAGTRLVATTHVHATDQEAARKFSRYWAILRIGAGLTVGSGLRAIRRRAEEGRELH